MVLFNPQSYDAAKQDPELWKKIENFHSLCHAGKLSDCCPWCTEYGMMSLEDRANPRFAKYVAELIGRIEVQHWVRSGRKPAYHAMASIDANKEQRGVSRLHS
jgi:hypothetical protein